VDILREELEVEAELRRGQGGIFTVSVDGAVVASKTASGFPDEEAIVRAVARTIGASR
jgi:selenoprotein W-related protein